MHFSFLSEPIGNIETVGGNPVKWQKTFLEDVRKGEFCEGLIAVTHSPFIFDNELDMYAHGIEEFRK